MLRSLTVTTLILGSVLAFVQPQIAAARDRDDYRYDRDRYRSERRERARHDRHEREEWREHERYEHQYRDRDGDRYRDYQRGYYDRWGHWHWY